MARPSSLAASKISDANLFDNFKDKTKPSLLSTPSTPMLPSGTNLLSSSSPPTLYGHKERLDALIKKRMALEATLLEEERAKEELKAKFQELGASFNSATDQLSRVLQKQLTRRTNRNSRNDLKPVMPATTGIPTTINLAMNFLMQHKEEKELFIKQPAPPEKQAFKDALEKEDNAKVFVDFEKRPYVVATYLKDYLQERTDPLIPSSMYDSVITIKDIKSQSLRNTILKSLLQSIPPEHYITLKKLINLLSSSLTSADKNGLTLQKLGTIFGPLILRKAQDNPAYGLARGQLVQILVSDYESVFFHEFPDIVYKKNLVESASLDRLLEKLLDDVYPETNYTEIVFFTHKYYIQTDKLLQQLFTMYKTYLDSPLSKFQAENTWNAKLRQRVLNLLKMWTEEQQGELESTTIISEASKFLSSLPTNISPVELDLIKQIKSWIFKCSQCIQNNTSGAKSMYTTPRLYNDSFPGLKLNLSLEILELSAVEIAQQLTLIDHALFTKIPPREFLLKAFNKPEESPNFTEMVTKFNRCGVWTAHEILKKDNVNQRAEVIQHFIKIAEECVRVRNFNSSCAIIGGLNNSAISRLKLTWEKLGKKDMRHYEKLVSLFSMENNFKKYRSEFTQIDDPNSSKKKRDSLSTAPSPSHTIDAPFIPYLALFSKDMSALEENYNNTTDSGLINVHKMRLLWKTVKQPLVSQRAYNFAQNSQIMSYLKEVLLPSDEDLFARSLVCEPRQRS